MRKHMNHLNTISAKRMTTLAAWDPETTSKTTVLERIKGKLQDLYNRLAPNEQVNFKCTCKTLLESIQESANNYGHTSYFDNKVLQNNANKYHGQYSKEVMEHLSGDVQLLDDFKILATHQKVWGGDKNHKFGTFFFGTNYTTSMKKLHNFLNEIVVKSGNLKNAIVKRQYEQKSIDINKKSDYLSTIEQSLVEKSNSKQSICLNETASDTINYKNNNILGYNEISKENFGFYLIRATSTIKNSNHTLSDTQINQILKDVHTAIKSLYQQNLSDKLKNLLVKFYINLLKCCAKTNIKKVNEIIKKETGEVVETAEMLRNEQLSEQEKYSKFKSYCTTHHSCNTSYTQTGPTIRIVNSVVQKITKEEFLNGLINKSVDYYETFYDADTKILHTYYKGGMYSFNLNEKTEHCESVNKLFSSIEGGTLIYFEDLCNSFNAYYDVRFKGLLMQVYGFKEFTIVDGSVVYCPVNNDGEVVGNVRNYSLKNNTWIEAPLIYKDELVKEESNSMKSLMIAFTDEILKPNSLYNEDIDETFYLFLMNLNKYCQVENQQENISTNLYQFIRNIYRATVRLEVDAPVVE